MAIVVEPVVSREKLSELLGEGTESEALDYKAECDLRNNAAVVEFAKDVGAMQAKGGYIVIGVDDHGVPAGRFTPEQAALFDEATVRGKMLQYFAEPIQLLVGQHQLETARVVVVHVGAHPVGFSICVGLGQYGSGSQANTAFRPGDVLVRHGTASERWRPSDVEAILERAVAHRKEAWRKELADDLSRMGVALQGQQLASGPAAGFDWRIDDATFRASLIELLRRGDSIPIRLLVESVAGDAKALLDRSETDELSTLLDRLSCMAALAITLEQPELLRLAVSGLGEVYDVGFDLDQAQHGSSLPAARLWLSVIERVLGVGALATRRGRWDAVRVLALRPGYRPGSEGREYRSWLRHALTMAAQRGLIHTEEGGRRVLLSLIALARSHVDAQRCLRPDLSAGDERIIDSICQFDMLANLAAIGDTQSLSASVYYPNFARFWSHRTTPILVRLLKDNELRAAIFPPDDRFLADALREIDRRAQHEAWDYSGWDGFESDVIERFLMANPSQPDERRDEL